MNGMQSIMFQSGSRHFSWQWPRCPLWRGHLYFLQHTASSEDFRLIVNIIWQLSELLPINIRTGLVEVRQKLSIYYYKYDQSPFYTWAAHKFPLVIAVCMRCVSHYLVLDPCINYKVLLEDYQDDQDLVDYLESSVLDLCMHYQRHYQASTSHNSLAGPIQPTQVTLSWALLLKNQLAVNFTARYSKREQLYHDELEEYFRVDQEPWELCNPLEWWVGCHTQFPNLFQLACDILTIPGTFTVLLHQFLAYSLTLLVRFCCCCRAHLFLWPWHYLPRAWKSATRDNSVERRVWKGPWVTEHQGDCKWGNKD